jgi:hypothetical protein
VAEATYVTCECGHVCKQRGLATHRRGRIHESRLGSKWLKDNDWTPGNPAWKKLVPSKFIMYRVELDQKGEPGEIRKDWCYPSWVQKIMAAQSKARAAIIAFQGAKYPTLWKLCIHSQLGLAEKLRAAVAHRAIVDEAWRASFLSVHALTNDQGALAEYLEATLWGVGRMS